MLKFLSIGIVSTIIILIFLFRKSIKPFFKFVFSKLFLINLILALLALFLIPYFTLKHLDTYTNHGVKLPVPNFIGVNSKDVDKLAEENNLKVVISDSVYSDEFPKGAVLRQNPLPNKENYPSFVKPNRKIYVTIVKQTGEYKEIPNLVGDFRVSKKIAKVRLEMLGFKPFFNSKPSKDNYVLELKHNGKVLKKGDKILKGEKIEVIHGNGGGGVPVILPDVLNRTVSNANQILSLAGLEMEVQYEGENITPEDSLNFVVYIQNPNPLNVPEGMVQTGTKIYLLAKKGIPIADTLEIKQ